MQWRLPTAQQTSRSMCKRICKQHACKGIHTAYMYRPCNEHTQRGMPTTHVRGVMQTVYMQGAPFATTHTIHARAPFATTHTIHARAPFATTQTVHARAHANSLHARTHANSMQYTCIHASAHRQRRSMCTWVVSNPSPVGQPHSRPHSAQLHQQKPGHENSEA